MKKNILKTSVAAALLVSMPAANAVTVNYSYTGFITVLNTAGAALNNPDISAKVANPYLTPITGTLSYDSASGAGDASMAPFDFFADTVVPVDMRLQMIGDGLGGPGTLMLSNMTYSWGSDSGVPLSFVLDAAGFLNGDLAGGGVGAVPAVDGTYTDANFGYLDIGASPIATTEFNTTNINGCVYLDCIDNSASGGLPLITDMAPNLNEFAQGDGVGIGGSPLQDGPFAGFSPNFNVTTMTFLSNEANSVITANCTFDIAHSCLATVVPIPAAVWLFGSGLLGLIGLARHKKAEV